MLDLDAKSMFFKIHTTWLDFMSIKVIRLYGRDFLKDILSDYLILFMNMHLKHFKIEWEGNQRMADVLKIDVEKFIEIRAKNFYIQRFLWYISKNGIWYKKIKRGYLYDEEMYYNQNECELIINGKKESDIKCEDGLFDIEYRNLIFYNNEKNIDYRIYLNQFIEWIKKHVKIKQKIKQKIINFIKNYQKTGMKKIELNVSFGSTTSPYRELIGELLLKYNNSEQILNKKSIIKYEVI